MIAGIDKHGASPRIFEFDIARVLAAIFIMMSHLWYFFPVASSFRSVFGIAGNMGLTLFLFLSGFFVSNRSLLNCTEIARFAQDKCKRLLPTMYVAVLLYLVVEVSGLGSHAWAVRIDARSVIANILCLQVFFYPVRFFVFWYVSLLIIYYTGVRL